MACSFGFSSLDGQNRAAVKKVGGKSRPRAPIWLGRAIGSVLIAGMILAGTAAPAFAAPIAWSVPAGTRPYAVAVNEATNKAYVANYNSNDVTVIDGSGGTSTISAGTEPCAVAVNEATNKAYVANRGSNNVTVIDGSGGTSTVPAGTNPFAVAVNEATNKAYVANSGSGNVTVIDGSGATSTVPAGTNPYAVAVNETTNKAYVANLGSGDVTVIDGSGATSTITAGTNPYVVAVNETTNKAYVANLDSGNVTVIDGSGATSTIPAGTSPHAVAVNETTNKAYVANLDSDNVTVIDGSGATSTITAGTRPCAVAVNETTNKAYVANRGSNNVTVIDGSGATSTIPAGTSPRAVAVNEATNKAYVANYGSDNVTVIDGSGATSTIPADTNPRAVAVNEATNKAYVTNLGSGNVTVIDDSGATSTIPAGTNPWAAAVNETTNKAYVANLDSDSVTVISYNVRPTVTTATPSAITSTGASSGGKITSDGWDAVTARGVCWGTSHNPTTTDSHTTDGTGTGGFTSAITGCAPGTRYYVRAYATNGVGTGYGAEESFVAANEPTVTTTTPSAITSTGASSGGKITSDGWDAVTARGVCWGTSHNPTTTDSHTTDGTGTGGFTSAITGCAPGTRYYVRAYATNGVGTGYGAEESFTTKSPLSTWYLAEGTSDYGFDTYINIENPNAAPVTAQVTYMTRSGPQTRPDMTLPPMSQTVINPRNDLGSTDFSTKVNCREGKTICVDRRMTWTGPGAPSPEAHSSVGVTSPGTTWYLPEGSSDWGFETWLLVQNPDTRPAECTLTYMIEGKDPVVKRKTVPASSRASFNMEDDIGRADASVKVTSNVPVIPERAMYRYNRREGHDSIGTTAPDKDYYLAEGTTDWGFTTYVLVQNPNPGPNTVNITYMTPSGPVSQPAFSIPANSRRTVRVNDVPGMSGTDCSARVSGSLPLIAERAMYWGDGTPLGEACHDSIGMCSPHTTFYMPDGEAGDSTETWTLVQNPNSTAVTVKVSYLTTDGAANTAFTETIGANSRRTFNMAEKLPSARAAVMVTCTTPDKRIMVERAMYWNDRGAGTDTIGGYAD